MNGSVTGIVLIIEVTPKTDPILKILDPIRFPKEIAFSFLTAAITEAASSGTLVPIAIIVTPITASVTPSFIAISVAPLTNHSLPKYKETAPIKNQIPILKLETTDKASSTASRFIVAFF